jgi:hypothetical protein
LVLPARRFQVASFGIEHLSALRARKHGEGLARGGQPDRHRKIRAGSLPERKEGAVPEEGVSDRDKPHLSRGAVEAV